MDALRKRDNVQHKARPSGKRPTAKPGVKYVMLSAERLLAEMEAKRNQLGMSRQKFAVLVLNICSSTYERWLRGPFNPRLKTVTAILAALGETDILPSAMTDKSDPVLAKIWDNPLDAEYDNY